MGSKAKDITEIIEGFKLGSLGAGPHMTDVQEPEEEKEKFVKIIKEGKSKYSGFSLGKEVEADEPFLCWKDPDGLTYFLELNVDKDKGPGSAYLILYGGKKLKIFEKRDKVFAEEFAWAASTASWDYKRMETGYTNLVREIKRQGVVRMVNNPFMDIFKPDGMYGKGFHEWLEKKQDE
jgi:hypothetical protein